MLEDKIRITGDNFSTDIIDKELQECLKKFITRYPGSRHQFEGLDHDWKVEKSSIKLDLDTVIGIGGEGTVLKLKTTEDSETVKNIYSISYKLYGISIIFFSSFCFLTLFKYAVKYISKSSLNSGVSANAEYLAAKEGLGPYRFFGSSDINDVQTTVIGQ